MRTIDLDSSKERSNQQMYGLYDREGILRYVNSDRAACLEYAALFELNDKSYSLLSLNNIGDDFKDINLDQNPAENNN
tara:strand:- start:14 stop:247 length:234 start_codon:yes stop_codon:yes gene_type:complete